MSKQNTVYTVWIGEDIEERLVAVCSTMNNAELIAKNTHGTFGNDETSIREYTLDEFVELLEQGYRPFFVRANEDGYIHIEELDLSNEQLHRYENLELIDEEGETVLVGTVWATKPEEVTKIVSQRRDHLLENDYWQ